MEVLPTQGAAIGAEPTHVLLRKARREAGLSQNEVARRLGMDVLAYCRLEGECGEIGIKEVRKALVGHPKYSEHPQ